MSETKATDRSRANGLAGALTVASYLVLGSTLLWTRLVGLDRGLWHDEILTVRDYVRAGPREILAGTYIPNNHELFSLLAWATSSVFGESVLALRLWSVIPFLAAVALVTAWLHVRIGVLTGVLYLFLVTASPLLLDLSRQARGYGLAFLAMSVLVVSAVEAERSERRWALVAFLAAGFVGTATLPIFGVAFLTAGAVLLVDPGLRRRLTIGLGATMLAIFVWYLPQLDDLLSSSQQRFGGRIGWWGLTSPVDQVVLPALVWIDGPWIPPGPRWLPLIVPVALVLLWSPLLRKRAGLILGSGVVATLLVTWGSRLYLSPRFVSYLLVPLFVLLASGAAHVLGRPPHGLAVLRTVVVLGVLALTVLQFAPVAARVTRLPREAHRDVADFVRANVEPWEPIYVNTFRPPDLEFYVGRSVQPVDPRAAAALCGGARPTVLVEQPYAVVPVDLPCLDGAGVRHRRFEQYAEGGEIDVWLLRRS